MCLHLWGKSLKYVGLASRLKSPHVIPWAKILVLLKDLYDQARVSSRRLASLT